MLNFNIKKSILLVRKQLLVTLWKNKLFMPILLSTTIHLPDLINDLGLILITASIAVLIFKKLKQPLVLGYLVAGF